MKFGKVFVFLNRAIMKLIHLQKLKSKSKPVELTWGVYNEKNFLYYSGYSFDAALLWLFQPGQNS